MPSTVTAQRQASISTPDCARAVECRRIGRVDIAGDGKAVRRWNLDDVELHGAGAAIATMPQLVEMLGAAGGDAIGKFGKPRLAHQMDILDLQIARRPRRPFEQEIDPGIGAVFHLAPDRRVIAQLRDQPGLHDVGDERDWDAPY